MRHLLPIAAAIALAAGPTLAVAQVTNLAPGYISAPIALPFPGAGTVCADRTNPDRFYVSAGPFQNRRIYRITFTSATGIAPPQLVAHGAGNTAGAATGNDINNNGFGDVWMTSLPDGRVLVTDNNAGQTIGGSPAPGSCIFVLADGNGDGDFLDAPSGINEVTVLAANPGFGGFAAAGIDVDSLGRIHVATSDGLGLGELIRYAADGTGKTVFYQPLDFGSGVAVDPLGRVVFGNADFSNGTIFRAADGDADGTALGPGETTALWGPAPGGVYGVAISSAVDGSRIAASTNSFGLGQFRVGILTGATLSPLCDVANYATGIAFDSSTASFAPSSGPGGQRLVVSDNDASFNGQFHIITPAPSASVGDWATR